MTFEIKKILVPVDFSEISIHALDKAIIIARKINASITLLHVAETYKFNTALKDYPKMNDIIRKGIEAELDKLISNKNIGELKINKVHGEGKIYSKINETASKGKYDLIVMGTHGISGVKDFKKFLLGSNAYRVVHSAPCPVITIKAKKNVAGFKNILLPLDTTKKTETKVGFAAMLAKIFDAKVHIVTVSTFLDEFATDISTLKFKLTEVEKFLTASKIPCTTKMIKDDNIPEAIMDYGKKINADLIAIVVKQQLDEIIIGSNARKIITSSAIPVLSVVLDKDKTKFLKGNSAKNKK